MLYRLGHPISDVKGGVDKHAQRTRANSRLVRPVCDQLFYTSYSKVLRLESGNIQQQFYSYAPSATAANSNSVTQVEATILGARAPSRSIQLHHLELSPSIIPPFANWLQDSESCPLEVTRLHSLRIQSGRIDEKATSILRYVGANLRELHLAGPATETALERTCFISYTSRNLFFQVLFLGALNILDLSGYYTPNLYILRLSQVMQTDGYTSLPWIKSLFEPLHAASRCSLKQLIVEVYLGHVNPLETRDPSVGAMGCT